MVKIYFSLEQVNELIVKLGPDIERLFDLNEQLAMLDNTKIEFDNDSMENFLLEIELNRNFHEKNLELYSLMGYLIRQGCVFRDLAKTEIDFYSRHEGKEILFCWKLGEKEIAYWHYPAETLNKRKSIKQIVDSYSAQLEKLK